MSNQAPVAFASNIQMPLIRFRHAWHVIAAARLDQ
jgi:hypothetical protein